MKLEDLIALGLTEEQAKAAIEKHEAEIEGLKSKNQELLGKVSKEKEKKQASESEIERLRQLEQKLQIEEAEAKKNYEEALEMVRQTESKKAKELEEKLNGSESMLRKLIVDNGLDAELDKAHVNPALKQAAKSMLASQLVVKDGQAVTSEGQSIQDLVGNWTSTDEGKAFILAQKNTGGGGQGSSGAGNPVDKKFSEMSLAEKSAIYRQDPSKYYSLRDAEK